MRFLLTAGAYVGVLVATVVVAFVVVMVLAGPHAGLLPHSLEAVVLGLGWAAVLLLPAWAATFVWRRLGKNGK